MKIINQAIKLFIIMTIMTGIAYPLLITIVGQILFPSKANGSFMIKNGKIIGSELIGQKFTQDKYFWPRPSAVDYNPLPSGASNLGPTNSALRDSVLAREDYYRRSNPDSGKIPNDLLFTSGSGLDPEISPEAAKYQAARIARIRGLDNEAKMRLISLIEKQTKPPDFGIFGEPRINVLELNLALDSIYTGDKR
jgi:potassium-transporting ATPase KdpC subunit